MSWPSKMSIKVVASCKCFLTHFTAESSLKKMSSMHQYHIQYKNCLYSEADPGGGGGGGGGGLGVATLLSYMVMPPLLLNSPSPFPVFCIGPDTLDSTPLNGQHPPTPPPPLFVSGLKRTAPPPPAFCIGPEAGSTPPLPPAFRVGSKADSTPPPFLHLPRISYRGSQPPLLENPISAPGICSMSTRNPHAFYIAVYGVSCIEVNL